jgi:hypothetical protein
MIKKKGCDEMEKILKAAKEHSIVHKWAWVVKEPNGEIYYTDNMEYTISDNATGEVVAEFCEGERLS